jgi:hypothetical protein
MTETEKFYDIEVHFPYNSVKLFKKSQQELNEFFSTYRAGYPFMVEGDYSNKFLINPALVTFIHHKDWKPF